MTPPEERGAKRYSADSFATPQPPANSGRTSAQGVAAAFRFAEGRRDMTPPEPPETDANPLAELMPPIMAPAWLGSLQYAIKQPDIVAAFREATGNQWTPARTPIDEMIDRATGADLGFIRAFAKWHNETIWGEVDGRPFDVGDDMEDEE